MRSFSLVIASIVILKFCYAAPWDSHSSNGGYRGPIQMPNDPNNYMELKDNGPNSYEGEDGYRTLWRPPKYRGFAPNEGNTYSSRAKSDRQNTTPKKNGSQVIEQPKPDKSIGNTNATKSDTIPGDTKGMEEDGFRALRQPKMEKGSAATKGNTNSTQAKLDGQNTMPKKQGSQAIEHPKPNKSIGDTNVTKSDTIPGDAEGIKEDGSGALMQPQMEEGSAPNKGNISSAGVNSDKPDPKHTDHASKTDISGDMTSGNDTNNSTHGDVERPSGSEETKEAESSSLKNSKMELNSTQNETLPKNETEDSQQGNIGTKPIKQKIVKLNETKTASVNKTGKIAGEDDKSVKGDAIKTDQDGEEASGSGNETDTDVSQAKSNATESHNQCSSARNKCDCDAELPNNRRALLERALALLERAHKLPRTIASHGIHSDNRVSANMTNEKLRVKRSAGSLLDREEELIGEIRKELSEDKEESEKSSGQDTVKEVNSGPEWKDDDEKEFVSGIDPNGKRRKRDTTDESYKERLEKLKLLQASFPTASAVKEMTFQQIKAQHANIPTSDAMKETKVDGGKNINLANANEKVLQSDTPKAYAVAEKPGLIECKTIDCKIDGYPSADAVKEEAKNSKKPDPKDLLRSYRPLDIGAVESESKSDNKQTKVKPLEADQHPLADAVKDSVKSKDGVMEMSEFPSAYAVREGPQLKIPAARLVKAEYPAEGDVKDSAKADAKIDAKALIANLPVASAVKEASDLGQTNVRNEAETNAASSSKDHHHHPTGVLDAKTPIANEPVASAVKEASVPSKTTADSEAKSRSHIPLVDAKKQILTMPAASAVKEALGMSQTNPENNADSKNTVASSKKGLDTKAQIANLPIATAVKEATDLGQTNPGAKAALTNKWHQIDVRKLITNMPDTGAVKEASDLSQNNTESGVSGPEGQEHDTSLDNHDGSGDTEQDENNQKVKNESAVVATSESSGSQPPSSMGNETIGSLKDESAKGGSNLEKSEPHMNNASLANDSAKSESGVVEEKANTKSSTSGSDTKDSKQANEENTLKDIIEGEVNSNATLSTKVDSEPAGAKTEGVKNADERSPAAESNTNSNLDEKEGVNSTSPALHPVSSESGVKESGSANKTSVADETETSDNNGTNSTTESEPSDLNSSQATLEGKDSTSNGTSKESQSLGKMKLNNTENDDNTKLDKASEQSDSGNEDISGDKTLGSGEKEQDEENFGAVNSTESTNRTLLSANGTSERLKTKLSEDQESPMNVSTEAVSEKSIGMVEDKAIANKTSDADDAETGNKIEAEGEVHDTADEPTAEAVKEKPVETKHDEKLNHTESANGASIMANGTSNKKPETKPSLEKESPMNASTEAESEKSKNTTNDEGIDNRTLDAGGAEMGNKTEDQDIVGDSAEDPAPEAVKEKPVEMKQVEKMTPTNEEKEDFPAADAVKEKPTSSTADKSLKGKLFPVRERAVALEQKKKKERSSRAD